MQLEKDKSVLERFLHAFCFEALAIGISAPLAAWLSGESMFDMGVVTIVIAVMALVWNMIYNTGYDRLARRFGWVKTVTVRVMHAIGFELGLLVMAIPFVAWWLEMGLIEALILDFGLIMFYLPYTYVYNLVYDRLRARYWGRLAAA
ncbi:multidrug/biocide efflux PACE transporter [Advenella sp. RU8]|uniref:multidrug/biocide efflux PACE transporter n=1 Tax=Advenella sp. RU8 TaxID=3399575 RepID=UPI003AAF27DC